MSNFNPEELRKLTNEAIERGKEMARLKLESDNEKELARHKEAKAWAEGVMAQIPEMAKIAASKGKTKVVVADTKRLYQAYKNGKWNTAESGLKFHFLCENLKAIGFDPTIQADWDGGGMDSWHNIVISW